MRHLLYYPMIHIPGVGYIKEHLSRTVDREIDWGKLNSESVDGEIDWGEVRSLLVHQVAKTDELWDAFAQHLSQQEPFHRVYAEGAYTREINFPFPRREGMQNCLADLSDSDAVFEKTENKTIVQILKKLKYPNSRFKIINAIGDYSREIYALHRINSTLKDGERGLLLFGAYHLHGLDLRLPKLPNCDTQIYPVGEDMANINLRYGDV